MPAMSQERVWLSFVWSYQTVCVPFALETVSWCQAPTMPESPVVYWLAPMSVLLWMKSDPSPFALLSNLKKQRHVAFSGA